MEHRKTIEVVRLYDQAIDWRAMKAAPEPCDEVRYAVDRDVSRLLYRPGTRPIVFRAKRLTRAAMLGLVARATTDDERRVRAFQAGVVEIEFADGNVWRPEGAARAGYLAMDDGDLDALEERGIAWADLIEVGAIILTRSELPFGCAASYQAPRSSVAAWAALSRRSAEPSPTDAGRSNTGSEGA